MRAPPLRIERLRSELEARRHADVASCQRRIVLEHARMAARLDVEQVVRIRTGETGSDAV